MKLLFAKKLAFPPRPPLKRDIYWVFQGAFWIYSLLWAVLVWWVTYRWHGTLLARWMVFPILIIGTPALSDLFQSYRGYLADWEQRHPRREVN